MTTLVTGAAGFIGFHVCKALLERGENVIGVDNFNDYYDMRLKEARAEILDEYFDEFYMVGINFADKVNVDRLATEYKFDKIIHLGAQAGVRYSIENPAAYIQSNLVGHANMLELARERKIPMVYASSSSVYGASPTNPAREYHNTDEPLSLYAATKKANEVMSESYANLYGIKLTGLRFFTVYGPWGRPDMAMWIFAKNILAGEPIQLFNDGDMMRDFTFIDDVVKGVLLCHDKPAYRHDIYNLGCGQPQSLRKMVNIVEQCCDKKAVIELLPMQPGDVESTSAGIQKAKTKLGWQPKTPISEGIPKFVEWYREYHGV